MDWVPPTFPDGKEWDPEHEDSRHYLNGFVGDGKECEYLNPGTDEWAQKHIAHQLRLKEAPNKQKSSKRSRSKSAPKRKRKQPARKKKGGAKRKRRSSYSASS